MAYLLVPGVLKNNCLKQNPWHQPFIETTVPSSISHLFTSEHHQAYKQESWWPAISVSQETLSFAGMFLHSWYRTAMFSPIGNWICNSLHSLPIQRIWSWVKLPQAELYIDLGVRGGVWGEGEDPFSILKTSTAIRRTVITNPSWKCQLCWSNPIFFFKNLLYSKGKKKNRKPKCLEFRFLLQLQFNKKMLR